MRLNVVFYIFIIKVSANWSCFSVSKCLYFWPEWLHWSSRHEGEFEMIFNLMNSHVLDAQTSVAHSGALFIFRATKVSKVNQVNQEGKDIR